MVHRVVVEDQSLRWYGRPPKIADDSIEFVRFQFHLPEDWDPLVSVAQFTQVDTYNMLLDKDTCFLPKELTAGLCKLSLFGYTEGKPLRATSIPLVFQIEESGFVSSAETPIPPTPDLYAQLIEYFSSIAGSGGKEDYVVQDTPPEDTSVLWVDPSDNSDDGFQEAVNTALAQAKASGAFNGKDGIDGVDGKDGYTPVKGVDYFDGKDGEDGKDGYTPIKGKDYFDGQPGTPGYTPQKGTDYYTDTDKAEMVNAVLSALPTWTGGSY